jgi:hypothetical protein
MPAPCASCMSAAHAAGVNAYVLPTMTCATTSFGLPDVELLEVGGGGAWRRMGAACASMSVARRRRSAVNIVNPKKGGWRRKSV